LPPLKSDALRILIVMTEKGDDRRAKPFVAAPRRTGARQPARLAVAATPRAVMAVRLRVYDQL